MNQDKSNAGILTKFPQTLELYTTVQWNLSFATELNWQTGGVVPSLTKLTVFVKHKQMTNLEIDDCKKKNNLQTSLRQNQLIFDLRFLTFCLVV